MKLFFALITTMLSLNCMAQNASYYLIRHAQAEDDGTKNPHLSVTGKEQAQRWAEVFSETSFDAIYSTNYHRTQETAAATANSKNLKVLSYDHKKFEVGSLMTEKPGGKFLIVGHSNTTPDNVNALLGEQRFEWIDHHEHGWLFIVRVTADSTSVEKLKIFH